MKNKMKSIIILICLLVIGCSNNNIAKVKQTCSYNGSEQVYITTKGYASNILIYNTTVYANEYEYSNINYLINYHFSNAMEKINVLENKYNKKDK